MSSPHSAPDSSSSAAASNQPPLDIMGLFGAAFLSQAGSGGDLAAALTCNVSLSVTLSRSQIERCNITIGQRSLCCRASGINRGLLLGPLGIGATPRLAPADSSSRLSDEQQRAEAESIFSGMVLRPFDRRAVSIAVNFPLPRD
jgi:hypothetical protein